MTKRLRNKIFVIYTTRDKFVNKDSLEKMCKELESYGDVFIDLLHNNALEKQEFVLQKLFEASFIVIVNSPKLDESKWAQLEIKIAQEQNKPFLGFFEPIYNENRYEFNLITNSNTEGSVE